MKRLVCTKLFLGFILLIFVLSCHKETLPSIKGKYDNPDQDTILTPKPPPTDNSSKSKMVIYYWDQVGTFPQSFVNNSDQLLPNTLGTGTGQPTGSIGWLSNAAYNNNLNSISNTIERYPGHVSLHLVCNSLSPTIPVYYDSNLGGQGASNFRSEVYLTPWHYHYSVPGELWLSWSYYFPTINAAFDSYVQASTKDGGEGCLHQLHVGQANPPIEIWQNGYCGNRLLLRVYYGDAHSPSEYYNTSVNYPVVAGKWMDFIEHVQWATDNTGLYELWCVTGGVTTKVFTYRGPNTYSNPRDESTVPYGGTPKFGIYHYYWHSKSITRANNSKSAGCTQLETYLGPVKMIYNNPGHYDPNGFTYVNPALSQN